MWNLLQVQVVFICCFVRCGECKIGLGQFIREFCDLLLLRFRFFILVILLLAPLWASSMGKF
jgi:hypothetical protein